MMLMTTISYTTVEGMGRGKLYNYLYFSTLHTEVLLSTYTAMKQLLIL